jgi:hypothetical protein
MTAVLTAGRLLGAGHTDLRGHDAAAPTAPRSRRCRWRCSPMPGGPSSTARGSRCT